jgi:hypothetical protein
MRSSTFILVLTKITEDKLFPNEKIDHVLVSYKNKKNLI